MRESGRERERERREGREMRKVCVYERNRERKRD